MLNLALYGLIALAVSTGFLTAALYTRHVFTGSAAKSERYEHQAEIAGFVTVMLAVLCAFVDTMIDFGAYV